MGAANQIVLQSFLEHDYQAMFRYTEDTTDDRGNPVKAGDAIKVSGVYKTIRIPSVHSVKPGKNVVIMTSEDFLKVQKDIEGYLEAGQRGKGIVKLDDIPPGYWDPAQQIAQVRGEMSALASKLEGSELHVMELEDEIKRLKDILVSYGWKDE